MFFIYVIDLSTKNKTSRRLQKLKKCKKYKNKKQTVKKEKKNSYFRNPNFSYMDFLKKLNVSSERLL